MKGLAGEIAAPGEEATELLGTRSNEEKMRLSTPLRMDANAFGHTPSRNERPVC